MVHLKVFFQTKYKREAIEDANWSKSLIFLIVKMPNLAKINVFGEENVNFSQFYVRHFPREFANSMVNLASRTFFHPSNTSDNILQEKSSAIRFSSILRPCDECINQGQSQLQSRSKQHVIKISSYFSYILSLTGTRD